MKKKLVSALLVVVLSLLVINAQAQPAFIKQNDGKSDAPHIYSILPGTDEWIELGSLEARRAACFVSCEEAESMTTRALTDTVINYPFIVDIYAFDSIEDGIASVARHFPALTVLMGRSDAVIALKECSDVYGKADQIIKEACAKTLIRFLDSNNKRVSYLLKGTNTYVYTPKGHPVPAFYDCTWYDWGITQTQANAYVYQYLMLYPSSTLVASPSPKYNCHSYSFYNQQTSNKYWIPEPEMFVGDNSYISSTKAAGRIVSYDTLTRFIHSGIIVTAGSTDSTTVVRSKWGSSGLYTHNADDCPYYDSVYYFLFRYYKLNPN